MSVLKEEQETREPETETIIKKTIRIKGKGGSSEVEEFGGGEPKKEEVSQEELQARQDFLALVGEREDEYEVKVWRYDPRVKDSLKYRYICTYDMRAYKEGIEDYLQEDFGGGDYLLKLKKIGGAYVQGATRKIPVFGPSKSSQTEERHPTIVRDERPYDPTLIQASESPDPLAVAELVGQAQREGLELGKEMASRRGNGEGAVVERLLDFVTKHKGEGNEVEKALSIVEKGMNLAKQSAPQPTSLENMIKPFMDVMTQMVGTFIKMSEMTERKRAEIADSESKLYKQSTEMIQGVLQAQAQLNQENLKIQRESLEFYKNMLNEKAEMQSGTEKSGVWQFLGQVIQTIQTSGPDILRAITTPGAMPPSAQVPTKDIPPPMLGSTASQVSSPSSTPEVTVSSVPAEGNEPEEGEYEEEGLLDKAERLILKSQAFQFSPEDTLKVLVCEFEADELREMFEAYGKMEYREEFYKPPLSDLINTMIASALQAVEKETPKVA